jgi:hypothetical protein
MLRLGIHPAESAQLVPKIMTTPRLALGFAGLCGVLALGIGVYFAAQVGHGKAASGQAAAAEADLRARLLEDSRQLSAERMKADALRSALGAARKPAQQTTVSGNDGSPKRSEDFLDEEIAENPQLRHLIAQSYRAKFKVSYGRLFRELGLKPEEIDRFGNLQLKMFSDIYDLQQAARLQNPGSPSGDPALGAMEDRIASQRDTALRELLGESGFQKYTRYEATLPVQPLVNGLAADLYYSPTPLTAQEADQLARIIAAQLPQRTGISLGVPKIDAGALDWDNILAQAQGNLLPEQFAALQSLRAKAELDRLEGQGAKDTLVKAPAP